MKFEMKNKMVNVFKEYALVMGEVIIFLFCMALGLNLAFALFKLSEWLWEL